MRFAVLVLLLAWSACLTTVVEHQDGDTDAGITVAPDSGAREDAGSDGGVVDLTALDAFCRNRKPSLCEQSARCGESATFEDCMSIVDQSWLCPLYRPGVKDGRIVFDAAAAARCERDMTMTCATLTSSCQPFFFTGLVPVGGACFGTQECVPGAKCNENLLVCPGHCVPANAIGAVAQSVDDCAGGLAGFVTALDGGGMALVCQPVATLGQPCTGPGTCALGFFCNTGGECEAWRGPNQECGASDGGLPDELWCAEYLECQTVDAGPRRCLPRRGLGAACGSCQLGLRCVGSFCAPRGLNGESCNWFYECVDGLFCLPAMGSFGPGVCRPSTGVGYPCTGSLLHECGAGGCERTSQGLRCVAPDGGWHPGFTVCEDPTP